MIVSMEKRTNNLDYWIRDINLADDGYGQFKIAECDMPGIKELLKLYKHQEPLAGTRITGCVTLTKETAVFIVALVKLGASVRWCSDNQYAINDEASAYLAKLGIPVFGIRGETIEEYHWSMDRALDFRDKDGNFIGPTQIIDDGCDITRHILNTQPQLLNNVIGITEQTTCGIQEIKKINKNKMLTTALININDSFMKKYFDNFYGIKESLIVGLHNALSVQIAGKNVVVYGYGSVGKGSLEAVKGMGGKGYLVEVDILKAVQAHMDGYTVVSPKEAIKIGDIFITATGCINTINKNDIEQMKNGAILCNVGHGNMEYNVAALEEDSVINSEVLNEYVKEFVFPNGKKIYSLCEGALLNMIAGTGNPPHVMNLTFVNHILAQIDIHQNPEKYKENGMYELSNSMIEKVALLSFPELKSKLYQLNEEQKSYIGL
ncbi:Adenosylhomocysteinase [Bacillus mycoides]|uniref:adenosylhomocysteinase n=1 Tax=Bacillus mycoides TaxID=1405 RepID=UPI0008173680|nr:adenosylhomocysteinase [Bacillus mycoides]SCB02622.1 Adenosylhomocysteinase [Bacillus mycoides]